MTKKTLIALGLAGTTVLCAGGFTVANAASQPGQPGNLAQKIASAFHLDAGQVQTVINQNRQDNQAGRETRYEDRLSQAVTDGKLTSDQKSLILAEHTKLQSELQTAMSKTGTDRRTAVKAVFDEGQSWAKANNIDPKWLILDRPHLRGGHSPMGPEPSPSASPSA